MIPTGRRATPDRDGESPVRDPAALASLVCADLHKRWLTGQPVRLERYLDRFPALRGQADSLLNLLFVELSLREALGDRPDPAEYERRFPDLASAIRERSALLKEPSAMDGVDGGSTSPPSATPAVATGTLVQPRSAADGQRSATPLRPTPPRWRTG